VTVESGAQALFERAFGATATVVASAPGRVNLIGEHTDYNDGLVLPFAIAARTAVAAAPGRPGRLRIVSAQRPGDRAEIDLADLRPGHPAGWAAYAAGALWARPGVEGVDLAVDSDVPAGAGLSSSAALECAALQAVSVVTGSALDERTLAATAQRVENDFVGIPCGIMDQTASASGRAGSVLFVDIGRDRLVHIPFDPGAAGLAVVLVDTRVHHELADGEYARRRADCERAARELGVGALGEIGIDDLDAVLGRLSDGQLRRRVRHVVTEDDRVRTTVGLLRAGAVDAIGPLLDASHLSLADDFEVSCRELDLAAAACREAGAAGARMTGGGFGGSVIALVPVDRVPQVGAAVLAAFAGAGLAAPEIGTVTPSDGATVRTLDAGATPGR
jgi:galactokinase